jgi:hypothetical protein
VEALFARVGPLDTTVELLPRGCELMGCYATLVRGMLPMPVSGPVLRPLQTAGTKHGSLNHHKIPFNGKWELHVNS